MSSNVMNRYLLIGGTGRCGTTLTKRIFGAHPDVFAAPEFRFTVDADGLLPLYAAVQDAWSPFVYDVGVRRLESLLDDVQGRGWWTSRLWSAWSHLGRGGADGTVRRPRYLTGQTSGLCSDFDELAERLISDLRQHCYPGMWVGSRRGDDRTLASGSRERVEEVRRALRRFLESVVENTLTERGRRHFVEDNTWNILWFDRMQELFSETRLVHVYRDPRDVVLSYTGQDWAPDDLRDAARMYTGIMARWREVRDTVDSGGVLEVCYEELLAKPDEVTQRLAEFAGLEWSDAMVLEELDPSRAGRWKRELDEPTLRELDELLGPELRKYGYLDAAGGMSSK